MSDAERTIYDSVTFHRGLGYSGRRVKIVEEECEMCGYDRQIETEHVYPENPSESEYECQNPVCPNYHKDRLGIPHR